MLTAIFSRSSPTVCSRRWARLRWRRKTFARFSSRKMWTPSPSPLPSIGMPRWLSRGCRRASTSMWKSHAATILLRARCWCRRSRSIASSCRWAHSSAPHPTPSRSSKKFTKGLSAGHTLRNAGTSIPGNPLGQVKKCPFPRSLIGTCGRVRHRAVLIRIMCTPTTGTGSESMAPVKR